MFVFKAAVVGAGTMGGEIAQVIANADIPVVLEDIEERFVEQGLEKASSLWQARVDAGKLSAEEKRRKLGLISPATDYGSFGDVDFVIEAVPERIEIKQTVFSELDEVTPGHAILASNTSGLSITEIGEITGRPHLVVGFHFFWPASYMRLVEIVEGDDTLPETAQAAANFAQQIRKVPVRCAECPGFVVNRILVSTASEVWRYQDESGASVEEVDELVRERAQMPMGPFRVADMSGLDTTVKVAHHLREAYGDRFYVHRGMEELVEQGALGAKTGKGFYEHS
jgi:3-hydroxyacyl-CoA dehydrogenase